MMSEEIININKTSSNSSCDKIDIHNYLILNTLELKIFTAVLFIVFGFLCILENTLVLYVILASSHLRRKPSYLFISSLSLADLLASLMFSYSFTEFHIFHGAATPGVFLFKLGGVTLSFTASLGSLLLTAFDRYICVHKPALYKTIVTRKRAILSLTAMWTSTIIISYLPLMGVNCCYLATTCSELFPFIDITYLASWIILIMVLLSCIILSYVHILWKAHFHVIYMDKNLQGVKENNQVKLDIMLAKILAVVLFVLIVCWGPSLVLMIHSLLFSPSEHVRKVFAFCSFLCFINTMINPLVYALRSRELRRRLKRCLQKLKCLKKKMATEKNVDLAATCDDTLGDSKLSVNLSVVG